MRKKIPLEARESSLANGWTVEAEESATVADDRAVSEAVVSPVPTTGVDAAEADLAGDGEEILPGAEADAAAEPVDQLSNAALVLLGVFGGLYLLYAWIWLSWAQFYAAQNAALAESSGSLGALLQQLVFWAAPLAPILWFLAALLLNRRAGMRRLTLWIVIGAIVLLPLPIFGGGGA